MKTSKPISTIGYQTDDFLVKYLGYLFDEHILDGWYFIRHKPEDNELKDHAHIIMFPNGAIDTSFIWDNALQEIEGETSPRAFMRPQLSKIIDWILYCTHNKEYLEGVYKKYEYDLSSFIVYNADSFRDDYLQAFSSDTFAKKSSSYRINHGSTITSLLNDGSIRISNAQSINSFISIVQKAKNEQMLERQAKLLNESWHRAEFQNCPFTDDN